MPSRELHKYIHRYYTVIQNYSASQQTVSADGLPNNAQYRKVLGIQTAIYTSSIRSNLCNSNRGCSVTCRGVSLTSFRGCESDVANFAGSDGSPPRPPPRLRRWLEGNLRSVQARQKNGEVLLCCQRHVIKYTSKTV